MISRRQIALIASLTLTMSACGDIRDDWGRAGAAVAATLASIAGAGVVS